MEEEYQHSGSIPIEFPCVCFEFLKGGRICFHCEVFYYDGPRGLILSSRLSIEPLIIARVMILCYC